MFRVYDTEKKVWLKDNICLSPNGELFLIEQSLFGRAKASMITDDRYVYHRDIDLFDKNQNLVYEGDYIRARVSEDKEEVGLVTYAHELSAYIILCVDSDTFYTLGSETTEFIEIIGNIFDGYDK